MVTFLTSLGEPPLPNLSREPPLPASEGSPPPQSPSAILMARRRTVHRIIVWFEPTLFELYCDLRRIGAVCYRRDAPLKKMIHLLLILDSLRRSISSNAAPKKNRRRNEKMCFNLGASEPFLPCNNSQKIAASAAYLHTHRASRRS